METKIIILLAILIIAVVIERIDANRRRNSQGTLESNIVDDFLSKTEAKYQKNEHESNQRIENFKKRNDEIRKQSLNNAIKIDNLKNPEKSNEQILAENQMIEQLKKEGLL